MKRSNAARSSSVSLPVLDFRQETFDDAGIDIARFILRKSRPVRIL